MLNRFTTSFQSARGGRSTPPNPDPPTSYTSQETQHETRTKRREFLPDDSLDAGAQARPHSHSHSHSHRQVRHTKSTSQEPTGREAVLERKITDLQTLLTEERQKNAALEEELRVARRDKEAMKVGLRETCTALARANRELEGWRRGEVGERREVERERGSNYRKPYVEDCEDVGDEGGVGVGYEVGVEGKWIGRREE